MTFDTQLRHEKGGPRRLSRLAAQSKLPTVMFILGAGLCAIFFGLLATTANPMMIALGLGMVFGPALLFMPELVVWIVLVAGFLFGILAASPKFSKLAWVVSLLSMLLLIPSVNNMVWGKQRRMPNFMLIALTFLVFSLLASIVQWYSLEQFIAGFKRYFQTFGLMFALTMIAFTPQCYLRWRKFLLVIALLQFPFALYELLVLVPLRGGLSLSSATTDVVAGTFGANLEGGSPNSVMVIYIFIALAFFVARWRAKQMGNKTYFILSFITMLPLGMGETKIAVIMLPIVGIVLLKKDFISNPLKYLPTIFTIVLLTAGLTFLYVTVIMHSSLDEVVNATLRYNVGNQSYAKGQILNRFTSITFWGQQQNWGDPLGFLLGNGLGSSYTSATASAGHLGLKYNHYGINLTAASSLLWDTGLIGFILFLGIFISAWFAAGKLSENTKDDRVRADAIAIQAAVALFLLFVIYNDAIVNLVSMELIYAVVLGYLGYLLNQEARLTKPTSIEVVKPVSNSVSI